MLLDASGLVWAVKRYPTPPKVVLALGCTAPETGPYLSYELLLIKEPTPSTLKKYGLSPDEWRALLAQQDGVCFVCGKEPGPGRLCIDHDHVKGWKKMPPEKRKLYVRGLLCWVCNHYYLGRGITVEKSRNVTKYLERYANGSPVNAIQASGREE